MERITLNIPEPPLFSTDLAVRITDLNYGQHVGHDTLMGLLQEVRVRWLNSHGLSEIDVGGCGLIMADTAIVFKNEVFHPATLHCTLSVQAGKGAGFDVYYRIVREADGALIAEAKTGMLCYDYDRKRPARMPPALRSVLTGES